MNELQLRAAIADVIGQIAKTAVLKNKEGDFEVWFDYHGHVSFLDMHVQISISRIVILDNLSIEPFDHHKRDDSILIQLEKKLEQLKRARRLLNKLHSAHLKQQSMTFVYDDSGHLAEINLVRGAA